MKKLGSVLVAYIIASVMVVILAWVGKGIFEDVTGWRMDTSRFIALVWLVIVGLPSGMAAAGYLLKQLGGRAWPGAWLGQAGSRMIPVGTQMAYNIPTVLNAANGRPDQVQIKQLEIRSGPYVISHDVLTHFLRTAWSRQNRGEEGLSRPWWVERGKQLERGEYEAIIEVLTRAELIKGRTPGRSGKLVMPPASALHHLEDQL